MAIDPIDTLRIATPCTSSWNAMTGDARVRHCADCHLNVYDIREMTRAEANALIARTEERLCVRLHRRADGTVITRDCPAGIRVLRRRASRYVAAVITALLSLPAFASDGSSCRKPRLKTRSGAKVKVEATSAIEGATITGIVSFDGNPMPGVEVIVEDEATGAKSSRFSDVNGSFVFVSMADGTYRIGAELEGVVRSSSIEHLALAHGQIARARFTMRPAVATENIVVGGAEPEREPFSTTISQDLLNRLPH